MTQAVASKDFNAYAQEREAAEAISSVKEKIQMMSDDEIAHEARYGTDPDILTELSKMLKRPGIKWYVAENKNTPTAVLEILSTDKDRNIKDMVALNPNTKPSTLKRLFNEGHTGAVTNRSMPTATLVEVAGGENRDPAMKAFFAHQNNKAFMKAFNNYEKNHTKSGRLAVLTTDAEVQGEKVKVATQNGYLTYRAGQFEPELVREGQTPYKRNLPISAGDIIVYKPSTAYNIPAGYEVVAAAYTHHNNTEVVDYTVARGARGGWGGLNTLVLRKV